MTRQDTGHAQRPPLPKFAYRIVNPMMKALLRSPLHRLVSNDLMLLIFEGRKSGKRYSIPVGYLQRGNRLYLFSHSSWWQNLRAAPVGVRLRGRLLRGTARIVEDRELIVQIVQALIEKRGEEMARRMGLIGAEQSNGAGEPSPRGAVFIEITLQEAPA